MSPTPIAPLVGRATTRTINELALVSFVNGDGDTLLTELIELVLFESLEPPFLFGFHFSSLGFG